MDCREKCAFCNPENFKDRIIYEDEYCFAALAREPYNEGHTIVILKTRAKGPHRIDLTDENILPHERTAFIKAIHKIAIHLKNNLADHKKRIPKPSKIYVCSLCDGITHLHAHLIPRYPFSPEDKKIYKKLFTKRDGKREVERKIKDDDLGGFWYIAEREKNYKKTKFWKKSEQKRAKYLAELAKILSVKACKENGFV